MTVPSMLSRRVVRTRISGLIRGHAGMWLTVLAIVLAALNGCASQPSTTLQGVRITELTLERVGVTFDVKVTNPWLVSLPLVEASGTLASSLVNNGAPFLNVKAGEPGSVPAGGSAVVPLTGTFVYAPLLLNLPNLKAGDEVPYEARLRIRGEIPATNQSVDFPELAHSGKIPMLALPEVSIKGVSWPTLRFDQVTGNVTLRIRNRNKFSIGPALADGAVLVKKQSFLSADTKLADVSARLDHEIAGNGEDDLVLGVSFDPRKLFSSGTWTALAGALANPGSLRAVGALSGSTPYAPVVLDFDTK